MKQLHERFKDLMKQGIQELKLDEQIKYLSDNFTALSFSTSFSYEDQLITYFLRHEAIKVFTLDTGRLFGETYDTWQRTIAAYNIKIEAYYPNPLQLQDFTHQSGPDSFYQSVEKRKQCCHIRKVVPLNNALKNQQIWITGLRAAHSADREQLNMFEWDEDHQLIKFHPLLHWSTEEVIAVIRKYKIPFNPLHEKGFVSIGCAPCTRAIREGESFRAGRWWWEDQSKKECGLHVHQSIKSNQN